MTGHLSPASLNSFVDGELSTEQLVTATEHLAGCRSCAAALLLLSVSTAAIQCNLQRTAIASGKPDAPVTGVSAIMLVWPAHLQRTPSLRRALVLV
jgi:anti-sigma factor RsiW